MRTKRIRQVEFVCPRCGADRAGTVVEQQRWYHVLGVPCVPLATLDGAVDCNSCGHRLSLAVLDARTVSALTECLALGMRYAAASTVKASVADGDGITPRCSTRRSI